MNQMLSTRSTTLILTAICLATILTVAIWLASSYVTVISVSNGEVVLDVRDAAGRQMLPDDPYLRQLISGPNGFLHDALVVVPWYKVALAIVVSIGSMAAVYFGVRWLVGRFEGQVN